MKKRNELWHDLAKDGSCDVLILGGGVNGSGLMRELSLQGVNCVLVDKGDFAAGASSTSSRMIHGGLRYLENAEFTLVAESVTERNRLLKYAPHYVKPLKTTIPIKSWFAGLVKSPMVFLGLPVTPGGRGALIVKIGLTFYDLVTGKRRQTPRHYFTSRSGSLAEIPGLIEDIACTATYWDAWISQAERLCFDMIAEACMKNPGCTALNYVSSRKNGTDEIILTDQETGKEITVKPRIVVNATGAWVDFTNKLLGFESRFMGGTKGSHLVVSNRDLYDALGDRMIYYEHADGRICITFRFMDKVIVGSTDIRVTNPDDAECEDREIEYMLTTLKGVFPKITISPNEIVYIFCGVRPLPTSGLDYTSRVPRSHQIKVAEPDSERGFSIYSLIGGKLTTFRVLAEETADRILLELKKDRKVSTAERPYPCADGFPVSEEDKQAWIRRVMSTTGLDEKRVEMLFLRYGTEAEKLATYKDSAWRSPLKNLPHYTVGEIQHIAANECIAHLSDIVRRRSVITFLGESSEAVLTELATIAGDILGWDDQKREKEIQFARQEATGRR
jgi:glycerol-3-phosphate dehydrogenase